MAATSMTTYLWFDNAALEAAGFYVNLFPGSRMGEVSYYQADTEFQPSGSVLTVRRAIDAVQSAYGAAGKSSVTIA